MAFISFYYFKLMVFTTLPLYEFITIDAESASCICATASEAY